MVINLSFFIVIALGVIAVVIAQLYIFVRWEKKQIAQHQEFVSLLQKILEVKEVVLDSAPESENQILVAEKITPPEQSFYSVSHDENLLTSVKEDNHGNEANEANPVNIMQIIRIEAQNKGRVYLHKEEECWCAYEKSAYELLSIIPDCEIEDKLFSDLDLLLTRCKLPLNEKQWRQKLSEKNAKCEVYSENIIMIIPASYSKKADSTPRRRSSLANK